MAAIDVHCEKVAGGWACEVEVASGPDVSKYRVHVASVDLARLAPAADRPQPLVKTSFEFLLEREPPGSILRAFDLMEIARYFPDYEVAIRRRIG
jgi:hypothetical protein